MNCVVSLFHVVLFLVYIFPLFIFFPRGARLPFSDLQQVSVQGTRALDPGSVRADWEYHSGSPSLCRFV